MYDIMGIKIKDDLKGNTGGRFIRDVCSLFRNTPVNGDFSILHFKLTNEEMLPIRIL